MRIQFFGISTPGEETVYCESGVERIVLISGEAVSLTSTDKVLLRRFNSGVVGSDTGPLDEVDA